jgi:hypothetical protein
MMREDLNNLSSEDSVLLSLINDVFDGPLENESETSVVLIVQVWEATRRFWQSAWFLVKTFSLSVVTGRSFSLKGESEQMKHVRCEVNELWQRMQWLQSGHFLDERHGSEGEEQALWARQVVIYHLRQRILGLLARYCRTMQRQEHLQRIVDLQRNHLDLLQAMHASDEKRAA